MFSSVPIPSLSQCYKVSWFLAPTVALIEQQRDVIAAAVPVRVGLISGASAPDQWKNAELWTSVLRDNRIVISTPQILLDALRHGYINLGKHISLLVFDEAHHAMSKHPYNEIMRGFYHPLSPRHGTDPQAIVRPAVLGLTASPIYSAGDIEKSFRFVACYFPYIASNLLPARSRATWTVSSVRLDLIGQSWRHLSTGLSSGMFYTTKARSPVLSLPGILLVWMPSSEA